MKEGNSFAIHGVLNRLSAAILELTYEAPCRFIFGKKIVPIQDPEQDCNRSGGSIFFTNPKNRLEDEAVWSNFSVLDLVVVDLVCNVVVFVRMGDMRKVQDIGNDSGPSINQFVE